MKNIIQDEEKEEIGIEKEIGEDGKKHRIDEKGSRGGKT